MATYTENPQPYWDAMREEFGPKQINDFPRQRHHELDIQTTGVLDPEQTMSLVQAIKRLDFDEALILPNEFLYRLNPVILAKNVSMLKLERPRSKKQIRRDRKDIGQLIDESFTRLHEEFGDVPELVSKEIAGINYRFATPGHYGEYHFHEALKGALLEQTAGPLILLRPYFEFPDLFNDDVREERNNDQYYRHKKALIRAELEKVGRKKFYSDNEDMMRKIVAAQQAEVIMQVPHDDIFNNPLNLQQRLEDIDKSHYTIKAVRLAITFPDYKEYDDRAYVSFLELEARPSCNCDAIMRPNYIRPMVVRHCAHIIAGLYRLKNEADGMDQDDKRPRLSMIPFPTFKPQHIDFYRNAGHVFIEPRRVFDEQPDGKPNGKYQRLPEIDRGRLFAKALLLQELDGFSS